MLLPVPAELGLVVEFEVGDVPHHLLARRELHLVFLVFARPELQAEHQRVLVRAGQQFLEGVELAVRALGLTDVLAQLQLQKAVESIGLEELIVEISVVEVHKRLRILCSLLTIMFG